MEKKFELIRKKIQQDSTLFSDRQRLKNLLSDCFQSQPLYINLLIMAYDENLSGCLKKFEVLTEPLLKKFRERLIKHNGISADNADWAVIAWFKIFNRQIKLETQFAEPHTPKRNPRPVSTVPTFGQSQVSVPDFGNGGGNYPVAAQTNKPTRENNSNSKKLDLLKRVYRQNFTSAKWTFWNEEISTVKDFSFMMPEDFLCEEMPNEMELQKIALNVVCHGKYSENDIIHLRMNPQCTFGFAFTYESFCTGGIFGDNIFKYADIKSGADCLAKITGIKNSHADISIRNVEGNVFSTPPLGDCVINFLDATKKIIAPNNLTRKNKHSSYSVSIVEDIFNNDNNSKGGYYHDGSWWTM